MTNTTTIACKMAVLDYAHGFESAYHRFCENFIDYVKVLDDDLQRTEIANTMGRISLHRSLLELAREELEYEIPAERADDVSAEYARVVEANAIPNTGGYGYPICHMYAYALNDMAKFSAYLELQVRGLMTEIGDLQASMLTKTNPTRQYAIWIERLETATQLLNELNALYLMVSLSKDRGTDISHVHDIVSELQAL